MWGYPNPSDNEEGEEPPKPEPAIKPLPRRAANGSVAFAIALGLRNVFEPERPKVEEAIIAEAPTRPEGPLKVDLDFEFPAASLVVVRRWMQSKSGSASGSGSPAAADPERVIPAQPPSLSVRPPEDTPRDRGQDCTNG